MWYLMAHLTQVNPGNILTGLQRFKLGGFFFTKDEINLKSELKMPRV